MAANREQRRLAAVMFCDIKGYTALVQKDEGAALGKVSKFRKVLEAKTKDHHGEVVEFYGDGSLSVYPSVVEAIECAVRMQEQYLAGDPVEVRIGIHLGDIVFKDGTVYGDGVNLASRIEAQGVPGAVLISDRVKTELQNHPGISTVSLGSYRLKNVDRPVGIHAVDHPAIILPKAQVSRGKRKKLLALLLSLAAMVVALALVVFLVKTFLYREGQGSGNSWKTEILSEKIAVERFQNSTLRDSLELIGDLAGDYLSRELLKTDKANVIAYRTRSELENSGILRASVSPGQGAPQAVFLITGSYRLVGEKRDSILFSASIQNTATGEILRGFDDQRSPVGDPFTALEKLNNQVKGYWESKGQNVTVPPDYQAYKAFLKAREAWFANDSIVIAQLQKAIRLDSSFTDPYFYLFTRYFDLGQYAGAAGILSSLRPRSAGFSARQTTQLRQMEAELDGRNAEAYRYFMEEYAQDPQDLFVNGAAMAYAMDYVNAPEKAVEIFEEIPLDRFSDYAACAYCLERLYTAQMAYLKLGRYQKAREVIEQFPGRMEYQKYFIGQVPYFVSQLDTAGIARLGRNLLASGLDASHIPVLHLVAAREFRLRGEDRLAGHYAGLAVDELSEPFTFLRGEILYLKGDDGAAYAETAKLLEQYPGYQSAIHRLGVLAARLGKREEALRLAGQLESYAKPYTYGLVPYEQAAILTQLGDPSAALEKLEQAISEGCKFRFLNRFDTDPDLMPLFDNPGFQALVHPLD